MASAGPRAKARRTLSIGFLLLAGALILWALAATRATGEHRDVAIAFGAVAALVTLTGYAFVGVGRFASRYSARSAPVLSFGVDRMIVAPWVGRDGAVDLRLEGRLGAAIPIGEVRAAYVRVDDDEAVVELETDHGPFDGVITSSRDVAEYVHQMSGELSAMADATGLFRLAAGLRVIAAICEAERTETGQS